MAISKKAGFFLGTAVFLDAFATGGSASLTGLGIASILTALTDSGVNILAGISAHHFSKEGITEPNQQLEKAFQKAVEQTIESVKKDFIEGNHLNIPWWRMQSLKFGFEIPSYDENFTLQNSIEQNFFVPLLKFLNDEKLIKEILTKNQELNPSEFIEMLVEKKKIQLPEFRSDHQEGLVKALVEGFKDRFMYHFVQNLSKSEPARKAYQIQLLQASVSCLSKIDKKIDGLLDYAEYYKISLLDIDQDIRIQNELLLKGFQKLQSEFLNQFSLKLISYRDKKIDIRDQFRFETLYTTFQGRINELNVLSDFLFDNRIFLFYAISGPGGAGKSRLANEFCLRAATSRWICGFCDKDKNSQFNWDSFKPIAPTLIVFDYIKGRKEEISKILESLSYLSEQNYFEYNVRVLLLEREFDEDLSRIIFTSKTRTHYFTYYQNGKEVPLHLAEMDEDDRWQIVLQVVKESNDPEVIDFLLSQKTAILRELEIQDPEKRPLFAFFSAVAIREGASITGWNTNDNLKFHLQRLEDKVWNQLDIWKDESSRLALKNLIWLAAVCEFLTFKDFERIKELPPFKRLGARWEEESFWKQLESLFRMENSESSEGKFPGLKPDLLAEFYISSHLSNLYEKPMFHSYLPILYNSVWNIRPERVWWMSFLTFSNFLDETFPGLNHYIKWVSETEILENHYVGMLFFNLAIHYQKQHRLEEAEEFYLNATRNGHIGAINNLALIYQELNRTKEAEEYYLKAIEKGDKLALNNLGILYQNLDRLEEAEKYYLKAIEKGYESSRINLTILYQIQNRMKEAEECCLIAIQKGVKGALNIIANLYQKLKRFEEAEKSYFKAVDNGDLLAYFNLAFLYFNQNKLVEAEKYYLLALESGDFGALNSLGVLYQKLNRLGEAEQYFLKAIKFGDFGALNNLAVLYQGQNRLKESEEFYLRAIETGQVGPLFGLAVLYQKLDRMLDAEKYYLKADEKGIIAAKFNLALLYEKLNRLEESKKYYLEAIEKDDVASLNNLALLYESQNRLGEAEKLYYKAIEKKYLIAYNNLAFFYWKKNQNKDFSWKLFEFYFEKNSRKTLNEYVQKLIISAWVKKPFYQENRSVIFRKITLNQPELIRNYLLIYYHDHSNFLRKELEGGELFNFFRKNYQVEYFAILYFSSPDDLSLKSIPLQLRKRFEELISDIREKRKFYNNIPTDNS
ncbi:tetratricopeptide repeat protein [Lunatimonas salinarum]|uniref:tetratricopeptide repeat protein n=1 Tax=Lunatimonas salinarum TaxID=1774590 RepID=UPI001ADFB0F1|nr:tetratricopeptide/SEL1-like repeat protein [Lunatimonas salinarum]